MRQVFAATPRGQIRAPNAPAPQIPQPIEEFADHFVAVT
jgi:hypothetical protein